MKPVRKHIRDHIDNCLHGLLGYGVGHNVDVNVCLKVWDQLVWSRVYNGLCDNLNKENGK